MRISGWIYWMQQTLCTLCLLAAAGCAAGLGVPRALRLLALSALGGAAATVAAVTGWPVLRWLALLLMALLPCVAWGKVRPRLWQRLALQQLLLSVLLTGLLRVFPGAGIGVLVGCGCVLLLPFLWRRAPDAPCAALTIRWGGVMAHMTALVDSGNLLRDAVTGLPVIVLSRSAAARLLSLPEEGMLLPGMRYLPIRTAAGSALMPIVHPDAVVVRSENRALAVDALVGISPDAVAGFTALVPSCLLREAPHGTIKG